MSAADKQCQQLERSKSASRYPQRAAQEKVSVAQVSEKLAEINKHHARLENEAAMEAHLASHPLRAVNCGVVSDKAQPQWHPISEISRKVDVYDITTEEVNKFEIRVAPHNHPHHPGDSSYQVRELNCVFPVFQLHDLCIGTCADSGQLLRSGIKPLQDLESLKGGITNSLFLGRLAIDKQTLDQPLNKCLSAMRRKLDELKKPRVTASRSIKYENKWGNSLTDIAQCVGLAPSDASCQKRVSR